MNKLLSLILPIALLATIDSNAYTCGKHLQNHRKKDDPDHGGKKHAPHKWRKKDAKKNQATPSHTVTPLEDKTFSNLTVFGPAVLKGIQVKEATHVSGTLDAAQCQFEALSINGRSTLDHSTVNGPTLINGVLKAHDSTLQNISGNIRRIKLDNTTVSDILIRKQENRERPQYVVLSGTTKVTGAIEFESGNGVVISKGSEISIGKVIGGVIKNKE